MLSSQTPIRFLEAIFLDAVSIPGKFMSDKGNAGWHLQYVCPYCSSHRKKFRNPDCDGNYCMWEEAWKNGDFNFPRNFGAVNWVRYYLGIRTDLRNFTKKRA